MQFEAGVVTTSFIDENPSLLAISTSTWNFASKNQQSMTQARRLEYFRCVREGFRRGTGQNLTAIIRLLAGEQD